MIRWEEIKNLHVINKLEYIVNKWYGVEFFWSDTSGKIKSDHRQKNYQFKNNFLKTQMKLKFGHDMIVQEIGRVSEELKGGEKDVIVFDSHFPYVKGVAAALRAGGEYLGTILGYPFVESTVSEEGKAKIVDFLVNNSVDKKEAEVAVEYLRPCPDIESLGELVELAGNEIVEFNREISKREDRILELNSELGNKYRYHMMVGKSKKMQEVYRLLEKIATSESTVLIQGDNGTGKELVAKAVHYYSPRKENVFLAVNCSAFNDNLLDSELFGHVKGAFTGALKDKKGLFEQADGGTLFLDEIGDTSLSMQVKLLRVLQEGTFLPVGASAPKKCSVRIIAATNKRVEKVIASGEFREDLYYRINVIGVALPALKERMEDIPLLIDYFMKKRCDESGIPLKALSSKAMEKILDYDWPGNVRELENEVERLVVLSGDDKTIAPELLSPRIAEFSTMAELGCRNPDDGSGGGLINTSGSLKVAFEEVEFLMIREGLERCAFNKSKLARELGISRANLIAKVNKYELDKNKKAA